MASTPCRCLAAIWPYHASSDLPDSHHIYVREAASAATIVRRAEAHIPQLWSPPTIGKSAALRQTRTCVEAAPDTLSENPLCSVVVHSCHPTGFGEQTNDLSMG